MEGLGSDTGVTLGSPETAGPQSSIRTIEQTGGRRLLDLSELWSYRELLYFITWRDVKVRYKQTLIGAAWAVVQPVVLMIVFTIVLHQIVGISSEGLPYPLLTFTALVPWTFFASSLGASSASLVASSNLITKVYFPRIIIPIASIGSHVLDFGIAACVLVVMMIYYGVVPGIAILTLPFFVILMLMFTLAVGVWLSSLNVKYRDVGYAVPFLIQVLLFASPVAYSSTDIGGVRRLLYDFNPMSSVIEGCRWALLGTEAPSVSGLVAAAIVVTFLLLTGLMHFHRVQSAFADVI